MNSPLLQKTMPVVFIGHGSPMNAIAQNSYTEILKNFGATLERPKAILCISAHWLTEGTFITSTANPKIIYDFYGFPEDLYKVQYPAPGSPDAALFVQHSIENTNIKFDNGQWGLDHGTWSVLKHMFPKADIPVLQLSLDINLNAQGHFKLGHELSKLREQGFLIVGSGNIVHNLRRISWNENETPFEWAVSFDNWFKDNLKKRHFDDITSKYLQQTHGKQSVPTPEHYFPALYIAGASAPTDQLSFITEEIQNGSISMTSFVFNSHS
jgi:4,5-DOPA dioxygenase extradiol